MHACTNTPPMVHSDSILALFLWLSLLRIWSVCVWSGLRNDVKEFKIAER